MAYLDNFSYQIYGPETGRTWVFLHGLMGYANNWRKIILSLQETERVLAYDQRGHGKSFKPESGYNPEDYADDLYLILQELGWEKTILVGHSMGGRNALNFAYRYPEKVEQLIIEDIGPEQSEEAVTRIENLLGLVPTPFANKLAAKEFFLNEFPKQAKSWRNPLGLGQYLYSNIIETTEGKADWRFAKEAIFKSAREGRAKDRWPEFRSLKMPTLVIRGSESTDLSPEVFKQMAIENPNVKRVEISDAGHWVHSDQPEEFIRVIKSFTGLLQL